MVTGLAADALGADDYLLLSKLTARRAIAPERLKALLTRADPAFAAVAAASIFNGQHDRQDWDPGELEPAWLSALGALRPARIPGCPGHDMAELFKYLAARYPDTLTHIITRTLDEDRARPRLMKPAARMLGRDPANCPTRPSCSYGVTSSTSPSSGGCFGHSWSDPTRNGSRNCSMRERSRRTKCWPATTARSRMRQSRD